MKGLHGARNPHFFLVVLMRAGFYETIACATRDVNSSKGTISYSDASDMIRATRAACMA